VTYCCRQQALVVGVVVVVVVVVAVVVSDLLLQALRSPTLSDRILHFTSPSAALDHRHSGLKAPVSRCFRWLVSGWSHSPRQIDACVGPRPRGSGSRRLVAEVCASADLARHSGRRCTRLVRHSVSRVDYYIRYYRGDVIIITTSGMTDRREETTSSA